MNRAIALMCRHKRDSFILLIVCPTILWTHWEDTKAVMPWYVSMPIGIVGLAIGLLFYKKAINPVFAYCDNKLAKLLRVGRTSNTRTRPR